MHFQWVFQMSALAALLAASASAATLRAEQRVLQEHPSCDRLPCLDGQGPCANDNECMLELTCNRGVCGWDAGSTGYFTFDNDRRGNSRVYRTEGRGTYWLSYKRDVRIRVMQRFPGFVTDLVDAPADLREVIKPYFETTWLSDGWGLFQAGDTTPEQKRTPLFGIKTTRFAQRSWLNVAVAERATCFTSARSYVAGIVGDGAAPLAKCNRGDVITRLVCLTEHCSKIGVECSPLTDPDHAVGGKCEFELSGRLRARSYEGPVEDEKKATDYYAVCPDGYAMTLLRWNFAGRKGAVVCRPYRFVPDDGKSETTGASKSKRGK